MKVAILFDMPSTEGLTVNEDRVKWLKLLRKGHGITRFPVDFPFELFGVTDWHSFIDRLTVLLNQIPNWPAKQAIEYALAYHRAFDWKGWVDNDQEGHSRGIWDEQLQQRRETIAARLGVSLRTVMRLEEQGAELLATYFEFFIQRDMVSKTETLRASLIEARTIMDQLLLEDIELPSFESLLNLYWTRDAPRRKAARNDG